MNPCIYGLKCPHFGYGEDGDPICLYPKLNTDIIDEDELFGLADEADCGLVPWDSELKEILQAYFYDDAVVKAVEAYTKRADEEYEEYMKKVRERERQKEAADH